MSTTLAAAVAILAADATLLTTATGGVYNRTTLGRKGLNRTNALAATAFDANENIKPCVVMKLRSSSVVDGLGDDDNRIVAQREMLEVWLYEHSGYANINTMRARIFVLLQGKQLGGFSCRWAFDGSQTDDMDVDAAVQRIDYAVISLK